MEMTGNSVTGAATYFRQNGHWHILLEAPEWVISDIKADLAAKGNVFTVGNYAGSRMLVVAASWGIRHPDETEEAEENQMRCRDEYIIRNPFHIDGRDTDISQIGYSIELATREAFPLNGVPVEYVAAIEHLKKLLEVGEAEIERVTELLKREGKE